MNSIVILISVEHKENQRLLQEYLGQYYTVVVSDSLGSLDKQFDLAIFDGFTLNRLWKQIRERKIAEKSLFLPFLLVTSRQDIRMVTRRLGQSIDEIIFTPIEKIELRARVEVLLRARRLSLELASKNIELQQEIVSHSDMELALRESEEHTKLLQKLTEELADLFTPMDISNLVPDRVVTAVGGHLGLMGLIKPATGNIELIGIKGFSEEAITHYRQMAVMERLPIMHTIRTGEPVWIETHEEYISRYPHIDVFLGETKTQAAASLPLIVHGQIIGAIKIFFPKERRFSDEEKSFLQTVAQQFAQALERARLYEQQREEAVFEERQRLARDLHDDISQSLAAINMMGQSLPRLWKKDPERAQEILGNLLEQTQATNSQMRTLLFELRPANIVKSSLTDLFGELIKAVQGRRKVEISCIVEVESTLPEDVHITLYRIVQETLNNMVKHSEATEGSISLTGDNGHLVLRIRDNGRGFDTQHLSTGFGLGGMRERAALIGATFEIFSANEQGTEIVISK